MMNTLSNSSVFKPRGKQTDDEETGTKAAPKKADTTDVRQRLTHVLVHSSNDTPHEARPEQPKSSLTNRLFRKMVAAPKPAEPTHDIEMGLMPPATKNG